MNEVQTIERSPAVLCLTLKRWETALAADGGLRQSVNADHVEVNRFVTLGAERYELRSNILHKGGSAKSGHYVAVVYHPVGSQEYWYYNDSVRRAATTEQVHGLVDDLGIFKSYVLFYERVGQDPRPPSEAGGASPSAPSTAAVRDGTSSTCAGALAESRATTDPDGSPAPSGRAQGCAQSRSSNDSRPAPEKRRPADERGSSSGLERGRVGGDNTFNPIADALANYLDTSNPAIAAMMELDRLLANEGNMPAEDTPPPGDTTRNAAVVAGTGVDQPREMANATAGRPDIGVLGGDNTFNPRMDASADYLDTSNPAIAAMMELDRPLANESSMPAELTPSTSEVAGSTKCPTEAADATERSVRGEENIRRKMILAESMFDIRVETGRSRKPEPDLLLEAARCIADECFRQHVTMPADPQNLDVSLLEADSGVRLPPVSCAFRGCDWHVDSEESTAAAFEDDYEHPWDGLLRKHVVEVHGPHMRELTTPFPRN